MSGTTAADCVSALFYQWVARFGVPDTVISDHGAQFTSALWTEICTLLAIKHSPTTAFQPDSNGMVERWHRLLKDALRARAAGWFDHLPWVLLALRAAPHEDSGRSPAKAT